MAQEPGKLNRDAAGLDDTEFESLTTGRGDDYIATASTSDTGVDTDMDSDETEHIKAQIEETRSQMGETIDALQEKLSFSNVSEQVSEQVSNVIESASNSAYDATIGKAVGFMKNLGNDISGSRV